MKIGAFKVDITPDPRFFPLTLLGYGDSTHQGKKIEKPIFSRAIAFESNEGKRILYACLEICFVSESLGLAIVKRLQEQYPEPSFQRSEIVLTATHTHHAPGGYCHSMLFNFPSQGYLPEVFESYVNGCVESLIQAWLRRESGKLSFATGEIPLSSPVAFNRRVEAWNRNPDVIKYSFKQRDRALNRTMDVLVGTSDSGKTIGMISWFAVHCTSMHRDVLAIHSDNKGIASLLAEANFLESGSPDAVAIFAQGAAGDVSPNFKKHWFLRETRGKYRSDLLSTEFNGKLQADFALNLCKQALSLQSEKIDSILAHHDLTGIPIPPEWKGGKTHLRTGPAELGCPFMAGTEEGKGMHPLFAKLVEFTLRAVAFFTGNRFGSESHGNKAPCIELTRGKVFGSANPENLPIPGLLDPSIPVLRFWSRQGALKEEPMTPHVMPIQLFRIGELGFASLPGEFTTQAGNRLRLMLAPLLSSVGVNHVIANGYANSYAGYITTEEEYQLQKYEGAMTHFGRYTLLAYMAIFKQLAEKWIGKEPEFSKIPEVPAPAFKSEAYLNKISARNFLTQNQKNPTRLA